MGFLDLFSAGGPLALNQSPAMLLAASGASPGGSLDPNYGRALGLPSGGGPSGSMLNLSGGEMGPTGLSAALDLSNPNLYGGYGRGYSDAGPSIPPYNSSMADTLNAVRALGAAAQGSGGGADQSSQPALDQASIKGIIDQILGAAPTLDQLFSAKPYNDAISALNTQSGQAKGNIDSAYTQALQNLSQQQAQAQTDNKAFESQQQGNQDALAQNQQGFLQSIGAGGAAPGSAMGVQLGMLAQQQAQNAALQRDTTSRIAQGQQSALDAASRSSDLGHQAALSQLANTTSASQGKVASSEASAYDAAIKELSSLLTARSSQASKLMGSASSFLSKQATDSSQQTDQTLANMVQAGQTQVPAAFQQAVYGGTDSKGQVIAAARDLPEAMSRLQTFAQHDPTLDVNTLRNLITGHFIKTKVASGDTQAALRQYLQGLG